MQAFFNQIDSTLAKHEVSEKLDLFVTLLLGQGKIFGILWGSIGQHLFNADLYLFKILISEIILLLLILYVISSLFDDRSSRLFTEQT